MLHDISPVLYSELATRRGALEALGLCLRCHRMSVKKGMEA